MHPTPHPDINALLQELLENVRAILGSHFVGMYLEGSVASVQIGAISGPAQNLYLPRLYRSH
jgi:hypothetical protein